MPPIRTTGGTGWLTRLPTRIPKSTGSSSRRSSPSGRHRCRRPPDPQRRVSPVTVRRADDPRQSEPPRCARRPHEGLSLIHRTATEPWQRARDAARLKLISSARAPADCYHHQCAARNCARRRFVRHRRQARRVPKRLAAHGFESRSPRVPQPGGASVICPDQGVRVGRAVGADHGRGSAE